MVVRRIEEQETTSTGIIIPDVSKDRPKKGVVLAVGKGKIKDDEMSKQVTTSCLGPRFRKKRRLRLGMGLNTYETKRWILRR